MDGRLAGGGRTTWLQAAHRSSEAGDQPFAVEQGGGQARPEADQTPALAVSTGPHVLSSVTYFSVTRCTCAWT